MTDLVLHATMAELGAIVADAVRAEIAAVGQGSALPEVLTRSQTAELLQCNRHTVAKLIAHEALPAHPFGVKNKRWRFLRSEVLAWIAAKGRP